LRFLVGNLEAGNFLIVFSIGIEIGQHFLPPRTFDFFDICANSTGVITGLVLVFLLEKHLGWLSICFTLKNNHTKTID